MKVAVIGAGWAGCAAAVEGARRGHHVTLFEAARIPGGRARRVEAPWPETLLGSGASAGPGTSLTLDNGQHILIGAYTQTLALMTAVGIDIQKTFLRLPLTLQRPDGNGLRLPQLPALHWLPPAFDILAGVALTRGWSWRDKLSLLRVAHAWQRRGFVCRPRESVLEVCAGLSPAVLSLLVEPLCVSALNTPLAQASGEVFLRVVRDSLFAGRGGSDLLLPKIDLSAALPDAALAWLQRHGRDVRLGSRVKSISPTEGKASGGWQVDGELFERVILACASTEASRLVENLNLKENAGGSSRYSRTEDPTARWLARAQALQFEAITTVYTLAPGARLSRPLLALESDPSGLVTDNTPRHSAPAQFVFDRGQLGGPPGLLAFVVSASQGNQAELTRQVLAQGRRQLQLPPMQVVQTIVEKRATFACVPGLQRPAAQVAPGLLACGDYVDGPYPATLEGAVRSGLQAARQLEQHSESPV